MRVILTFPQSSQQMYEDSYSAATDDKTEAQGRLRNNLKSA